MISFLIPTYNFVCTQLVNALCYDIADTRINCEVIVMDDGSTDLSTIKENQIINNYPMCRFIQNPTNIGRAAIRNKLAQTAKYPKLVFLDADTLPCQIGFVRLYIDYATNNKANVVCGGIRYRTGNDAVACPLRLCFGLANEANTASQRNANPYNKFSSANFMIDKYTFLQYQFDESICKYGHEDTLFGKVLEQNNIPITHIDNPVYHDDHDTSNQFLSKTRLAIDTLVTIENKIGSHSRLLNVYNRIKPFQLHFILAACFLTFRRIIEINLLGRRPSLSLFNFYKLCYLCFVKLSA